MALKLLDNEQVISTLKKTPLIWVTPSLLGFLAFAFFDAFQEPQHQGIFLILALGLFIGCIVEIIRRHRYAGYVTNKRLVLHFGLFLHEREMRFEQLEGIQVERYKAIFWHQIHVGGTGGTTTLFDYVSNYNEFKQAIYNAKGKLNQVDKT